MKRLRKLAGIAGVVLTVFLLDYLEFYLRLGKENDVRVKYRAVREKTNKGERKEENDPAESLTAAADATETDTEKEKTASEDTKQIAKRETDVSERVTESTAVFAGNTAASSDNTEGNRSSEPERSLSETENRGNSNNGAENGNETPDPGPESLSNDDRGASWEDPADPDDSGSQKLPTNRNGFLMDEEQMIVGVSLEELPLDDGYLEFPTENCSGIRRGAFASCGDFISEIYIPGNITYMENGCFQGLYGLEWLDVDGSNLSYVSIEGVIYDVSVSSMIAVPAARCGGQIVPGSVNYIADEALADSSLSKLDLRRCEEVSFGSRAFGDGDGNGLQIYVKKGLEAFYYEELSGWNVVIKGYQ